MASIIKAVRKSPSHAKKDVNAAKHCKLPEDWSNTAEPLNDGVTFYVSYVGSTPLHKENGAAATTSAVKRIVAVAKLQRSHLPRVAVMVCPRGVRITELATGRVYHSLSIYRIAFCSTDSSNERVCAFNARSVENDAIECHAFLCSKKKIAKAITLTIAQAFKVAHEHHVLRQGAPPATATGGSTNARSLPMSTPSGVGTHESPASAGNSPPSKLSRVSSTSEIHGNRKWVNFDEEQKENTGQQGASLAEFDDGFAELAESRLNPGETLFGTTLTSEELQRSPGSRMSSAASSRDSSADRHSCRGDASPHGGGARQQTIDDLLCL